MKATNQSIRPLICLDPGHGGHDPGAVNQVSGLKESTIALDVCMRMKTLLEDAGFRVLLTRKDDRFIPLAARAELANDAGADAFVSIHCNSASSPAARGYEVFTSPGDSDADDLAEAMMLAFGKEFPANTARTDLSDGDLDKEANFAVLKNTRMIAVLFELEFIHTAIGARFLASRDNQEGMAQALVNGILAHCGRIPALQEVVKKVAVPDLRAPLLMVRASLLSALADVDRLLDKP